MIKVSAEHLERLCAINSFPLPADGIVFFGLRGCLPVEQSRHEFRKEHQVALAEPDYIHARCTLGQWRPEAGKFALFPGSTVPHRDYVKAARLRDGRGANEMMTGYYPDYRKGRHKPGKPSGHDAFRQTRGRPIRRTTDDYDFDSDDRVEFDNPFDNLHAAWCMGVSHPKFASAGCQVVVGYPKPELGPWKAFKENAYGVEQDSFPYVLLEGRTLQAVTITGAKPAPARLRFGSHGPLVETLQKALKERGYYEGRVDQDFGERTLRAVLAFQTAAFGPSADDGIVGPVTAAALDLDWPRV